MDRVTEETIQQFFTDVGFTPPAGKNVLDFIEDKIDGILSTIDNGDGEEDVPGVPDNVSEIYRDEPPDIGHPAPTIFADFYMFNDPGSRNESDKNPVHSDSANKLNVEYQKRDFRSTHSFSDIHDESLTQPKPEFPRHVGVKSQTEQQPIVLNQPTLIEGVVYPAGTKIRRIG